MGFLRSKLPLSSHHHDGSHRSRSREPKTSRAKKRTGSDRRSQNDQLQATAEEEDRYPNQTYSRGGKRVSIREGQKGNHNTRESRNTSGKRSSSPRKQGKKRHGRKSPTKRGTKCRSFSPTKRGKKSKTRSEILHPNKNEKSETWSRNQTRPKSTRPHLIAGTQKDLKAGRGASRASGIVEADANSSHVQDLQEEESRLFDCFHSDLGGRDENKGGEMRSIFPNSRDIESLMVVINQMASGTIAKCNGGETTIHDLDVPRNSASDSTNKQHVDYCRALLGMEGGFLLKTMDMEFLPKRHIKCCSSDPSLQIIDNETKEMLATRNSSDSGATGSEEIETKASSAASVEGTSYHDIPSVQNNDSDGAINYANSGMTRSEEAGKSNDAPSVPFGEEFEATLPLENKQSDTQKKNKKKRLSWIRNLFLCRAQRRPSFSAAGKSDLHVKHTRTMNREKDETTAKGARNRKTNHERLNQVLIVQGKTNLHSSEAVMAKLEEQRSIQTEKKEDNMIDRVPAKKSDSSVGSTENVEEKGRIQREKNEASMIDQVFTKSSKSSNSLTLIREEHEGQEARKSEDDVTGRVSAKVESKSEAVLVASEGTNSDSRLVHPSDIIYSPGGASAEQKKDMGARDGPAELTPDSWNMAFGLNYVLGRDSLENEFHNDRTMDIDFLVKKKASKAEAAPSSKNTQSFEHTNSKRFYPPSQVSFISKSYFDDKSAITMGDDPSGVKLLST